MLIGDPAHRSGQANPLQTVFVIEHEVFIEQFFEQWNFQHITRQLGEALGDDQRVGPGQIQRQIGRSRTRRRGCAKPLQPVPGEGAGQQQDQQEPDQTAFNDDVHADRPLPICGSPPIRPN